MLEPPQSPRPPARSGPTREVAALHEAAHAVTAVRAEAPIRQVWISLDGQGRPFGECEAVFQYGPAASDDLLTVCAARLVAGWVAECLAGYRDDPCEGGELSRTALVAAIVDPNSHVVSDISDLARIVETSRTGTGHFDRLFVQGWGTARVTLQKDWAAVEAVQEALLARGKLTGEEVVALVTPKFGKATASTN